MTDGRNKLSADGASEKKHFEQQENYREEEMYLPPRKTVHPSEKGIWTRRFYLTLVWLFIILTSGLLIWGMKIGR